MKLTPRLTLTFVLYAAALLAGVGLLAYTSGRESLRSAVLSELQATAIEKQAALNAWVEEKQADIIRLAAAPAVIESAAAVLAASPDSPEARDAHDRLLAEIRPRVLGGEFQDLMIIEPQTGQVVAATNPGEEGRFKEDRPFFINGKNGPYVQNLYFSVALHGLAMTAAAPLRAPDGRLLAVLAGRLDLRELNAIISRRTGLRQTDDAYLVNTSSLFVTQPRFISDPAVLQRGVHTEAVKRCLEQASGEVGQKDYRNVPTIAVYRWLPERKLCLVVEIDQAEAYGPARAFGGTVAVISAVALLVALGVAVTLARSITRSILALQAGAARFSRGELAVRLPETSRDELGALAREFNAMAAALAAKETELRANAAELEDRVNERTAELAQSEERYRSTLENLLEGGQLIGFDWRYLYLNEAAARQGQKPQDELLGRTMMEVYPGIENTDLFVVLQRCMAERAPAHMENQFVFPDGTTGWFELSIQPVPDGIFILSNDITERKQADAEIQELNVELEQRVIERTMQLEDANKELEAFSYSVSHDLRAPLRGIDGWSLALLEDYRDSLDEQGRQYLGRVRSETQRMGQLIDDMLQLARVTRAEMRQEPVDLSDLAQTIAARLQETQPKRPVVFNIQPGLSAQGDAILLEAMLANLLSNAFKFTGKTPQARIEFGQTEAQDHHAFFVRDNGVGFDMAYAQKLFGAFQRLHKASDFPGTGVGLATVQRVIHRHGGRVWAEAGVNQGATFYFTLAEGI